MSVFENKLAYLEAHGAEKCGIMFRMPGGSIGCIDEFGRVTWINEINEQSRGPAMVTADDDQLDEIFNQGC